MSSDKNKPAFYLIDTKSAFYKPPGVRIAICVSVLFWAGLELWFREPFWSVISVAVAVYCFYVLFFTYKPPEDAPVIPPVPAEDTSGDDVVDKAGK